MAVSFEALLNGSPRQATIAEQAVLDGRYVAGDKNENAACTRLNGRGLLRRDPKNGFVWYPNDALRTLVSGPGAKPSVTDPMTAAAVAERARASCGQVDKARRLQAEARVSSGLEPGRASNRNAARLAVGTRTATRRDRGQDLYETPVEAIRTLLAVERFGVHVLEPSVGKGAILRPLEEAGYQVSIADLVDRGIATRYGECQRVGDFLQSAAEDGNPDIVTNPPYGIANAYIAHALRVHRPRRMAMLLNLNFLCGFADADRCFVMDQHPPSRIHVFTRRLPMMHRDGWDGNRASSQMNTAWFVWQRNDDGSYGEGYPQIIRIDWKACEHAAALPPDRGRHDAQEGPYHA